MVTELQLLVMVLHPQAMDILWQVVRARQVKAGLVDRKEVIQEVIRAPDKVDMGLIAGKEDQHKDA